ncbi:MAG: HD domain-containing protein [Methylophilaceae bacterium]|nr:HD domain-containing protein [Methylophilaceae bacterium]
MIHGSSALQIPAVSDQETEAWIMSLSNTFSATEVEVIKQACQLASLAYDGHKERTELPLMQHATATAAILVSLHLDAEAVAAAILYATPRHIDNWQETLKARFGDNIRNLVAGLMKIEQVQTFSDFEKLNQLDKSNSDQSHQIESLRKMLLAMVQDIRVVLIKLAERTQTLRSLSKASAHLQQKVAREIQGVYAPLANRLGVWQLKWEMEDLSLRFLEPVLYKEVAKSLDARRLDREQYIQQVEQVLKERLSAENIKADVAGRPKHIYSIINKMRRKHLTFEQLFDVHAVRILVNTVEGCYSALSVVQALWQPIASEFDDYIAKPKSNNYRSLHTAVNGPKDLALEVQIRTHEMHAYSELGVAAHWRYKDGSKDDAVLDEKIALLRQILTWEEEPKDSSDLLEQFNTELFQENVYVFTPQGNVVDLPKGATPIDFAYAVHTDLGHRTRGAKVDGHIVPLNYQLQNAQHVEILTNKIGAPSRDWIRATLGYLKSASARAKVRHWFRRQTSEERSTGRPQEAVNPKLTAKPQQHVPHKTPLYAPPTEVILEGVGNLQTNMAKCCKPVFPDAITAYVTRDRGVTVHKQDCRFIERLESERHDRLFSAEWCQ